MPWGIGIYPGEVGLSPGAVWWPRGYSEDSDPKGRVTVIVLVVSPCSQCEIMSVID